MAAKECTMCAGTGRSDLDSTGLSIEEIKNSKYACEFCGGDGQVDYDNSSNEKELEKAAHFEAFKNHHIVELSKARNKEELLDMINWVASKIQNFNP